jgi:hypothetical protein
LIGKSIWKMVERSNEAERIALERSARAERIAEVSGCGQKHKNRVLKNIEDSCGSMREAVDKFVRCNFNIHEEDDILLRQAVKCRVEDINVLLKVGANVHAKNDEALLLAIAGRETEIVHALLKAGANPRVNNNEPLIMAVNSSNEEIIKELLAAGADACDKGVKQAAGRDHPELAAMLAEDCRRKTGGKR